MEKISDIIDNIKVREDVLTFVSELEEGYLEYLRLLKSYGEDFVELYLSSFREYEISATINDGTHIPFQTVFRMNSVRQKSIDNAVSMIEQDFSFNEGMLHNVHKKLMEKDKRDYIVKGKYRQKSAELGYFTTDENGKRKGVVLYEAPSPELVPEMMQEVLNFYNSEIDFNEQLKHPFLQAAVAHALVIHIQPYMDGNGRISRVLHHTKLWQHANDILGINLSSPALYFTSNYMLSRKGYRGKIDEINKNALNNEAWNRWFSYNLGIIYEKLTQLNNEIGMLKMIYENSRSR
jgi:Uncharacterized conserved protein